MVDRDGAARIRKEARLAALRQAQDSALEKAEAVRTRKGGIACMAERR